MQAPQLAPEMPAPLPPRKKKRRRRGFLEVFLHKVQKPEVILIGVWWFIMLVLVIYMAEMGPVLWEVWRPLAFLLSIPVVFFGILAFATL
mmetsp:Transcript_119030/g.167314  ORF Transcript_119030/g.167314 Transcript_119030/m.167314 type:complete len:90 (-) Transcript_119030:93-362(-)|eukprot:s1916_g2.t1